MGLAGVFIATAGLSNSRIGPAGICRYEASGFSLRELGAKAPRLILSLLSFWRMALKSLRIVRSFGQTALRNDGPNVLFFG